LIIVPDGILHLLPFESLVDDSGDFLLRSHVVSYAPSASLLHLLTTRPSGLKPRRTLLALGGVLYQNQAPRDSGHLVSQAGRGLKELFGSHLENLPNTKDEVLSLGKILSSNSTLLVGAEATETAFKAQPLADFKILHLAAHGIADVEFPDRAALVLGRDNGSNEDGLLQAREIMTLHLNADLVTLSACDTAFGKLQGEEGISNLEEAFFIAGARAVVASLWTADDAVTTALMERFYRHIVQGDDKANALRLFIGLDSFSQATALLPFLHVSERNRIKHRLHISEWLGSPVNLRKWSVFDLGLQSSWHLKSVLHI
jgi:CHAT domain-containing protein